MKTQRLRGMHDIAADGARDFAEVERLARQVFATFGFEELRTPILEPKELFTRALGSDTDVVKKQMYEFTDRSEEKVALRPEGTAGVVRAYLENNFDKTMGLAKFFYAGPMFRSERPQAGRLRQFHQIGVETLGTESPLSDAEVIHCLDVFLRASGAGGFTLRLNNLGTFQEREGYKEVLRKYFKPHVKSLCEDCRDRLTRNVFRILDCKNPACRAVIEKAPPILSHLSQPSQDHFAKVLDALEAASVKSVLDPYLVRGLDYYTRTVFEVSHPKLGSQDALAAGGRYDRLIESFGGSPAGAAGFAVGTERLLMCRVPEKTGDGVLENSYFVASLGEGALREAFKLVSDLRENGVRAEMDPSPKSLKSQMRYADKLKYRYVIVLGDNEIQSGQCKIKDMKSGVEQPRGLASLAEEIARA